ncbi:MAG: ABC transporter permease [Ignavibacteria bacterium]|nr:ABC transporter permease [Ignavibacteria bacterium]
MKIFKLILKNFKRHKLRLSLTIVGIAIAVMAFSLLRTVITAWNAGVDIASPNRVVTSHAVSFIMPLPISYRDKIAKIPGIESITYANWFQGVYKDKNQFFPRMAIDAETFFQVYYEYKVDTSLYLEAMKKQRNGCIIGKKIAKEYNLKIGDKMIVDGDIYPGRWEFEVVGYYSGKGDPKVDETWMVFNWSYLDEQLRQSQSGRGGYVGWYVFKVKDPNTIAEISEAIDKEFFNSDAKTKTQTEQAFNQSFVSMSGAILSAIEFVSFVIIGILFLVLANTMIMSARERIREYAVLKTLGFTTSHLVMLITGEAIIISFVGGIFGIAVTFPIVDVLAEAFARIFPIFIVANSTLVIAVSFIIVAGIISSLVPLYRSIKTSIVDGLRHIG